MNLEQQVRSMVALALAEDRAQEDITTQACIDPSARAPALLILKKEARVAGLPFLRWILDAIDPSIQLEICAEEGKDYAPETLLAHIEGRSLSIFAIERTLLNLLQHLSGIATTTAQYVRSIADTACVIMDTRKTLPGLRAMQKYGVKIGGGQNHRFDLKESILIKNNHLRLLKQSISTPIATSIAQAREKYPDVKIEIEVENLNMLEEALPLYPDVILLDNMPVAQVAQAVHRVQGRVYLEASGGINLSNVKAYAQTGVNAVSIGALTHSATAADMSLRMMYNLPK